MLSALRRAAGALLLVLLACAATAGFARTIAQPVWLGLYEKTFTFTPGQWFGHQLLTAYQDPERTCLVIGASSAREGIDAELLSAALPGWTFVNLGTTATSDFSAFEIQSRIVADSGHRFGCVIAAIHPILMKDFTERSYEVIVTDYISQLSFRSAAGLTQSLWEYNPWDVLAAKFWAPMSQHSLMLRRLITAGLLDRHRAWIDPDVAQAQFETVEDELIPEGQYHYTDRSVLERITPMRVEFYKENGFDDPANFDSGEPDQALLAALSGLSGITDRFMLVELPQAPVVDRFERLAEPLFDGVISRLEGAPVIYHCDVAAADQPLLHSDDMHMNGAGRERLSQSLVVPIGLLLGEATEAPSDLCVPGLRP